MPVMSGPILQECLYYYFDIFYYYLDTYKIVFNIVIYVLLRADLIQVSLILFMFHFVKRLITLYVGREYHSYA